MNKDLFSLAGKVALVTGGGRGIGRYIATGLASAGADLILTSRTIETLKTAAEELTEEFGVRVLPIACDMGDVNQIADMFGEAKAAFDSIDILFNNSGTGIGAPTLEHSLEDWDQTFNVNLRGPFVLVQHWAKHMKTRGGGRLINISSIVGLRGTAEASHPLVAYSTSKAAMIHLTQNLAIKLAPLSIRVNGIAPGYFRTDMTSFLEAPENEAMLTAYLEKLPLGRGAGEDDMAGVAVFLASDASAFITGHTLVVDGGQTAGL
jgi:NAD(P)-dependent dehydrogenase (short-subunit alcohol dehydrogenase family)